MNALSSITIVPAIYRAQRGTLLRWRDHRDTPREPRRCSYWFADDADARFVRDTMRSGATFEEAHRLAWERAHVS